MDLKSHRKSKNVKKKQNQTQINEKHKPHLKRVLPLNKMRRNRLSTLKQSQNKIF